MNAHDILKQKLLDTEEDHTTGITREEVRCIQSKLESLHGELVEAVDNKTENPDYAYPTVAVYEEYAGYKVGEAFVGGWMMARVTNQMLGI